MPTGFAGLFQSFDVNERVATEDVTAYGANVYGAFLSNGTPVQTVTVNGFGQHGAASSTPGFGGAGILDSDGSSATLTMDTGSTLVGSYIVTNIRATHSRVRGAVGISWELQNAGDITATWASS